MNVEKASSYTLIFIFILGIFVYLVDGISSFGDFGLGAVIIAVIILLFANYIFYHQLLDSLNFSKQFSIDGFCLFLA